MDPYTAPRTNTGRDPQRPARDLSEGQAFLVACGFGLVYLAIFFLIRWILA